jgi:hypothetical protein
MRQRRETVEHPFGTMKARCNIVEFECCIGRCFDRFTPRECANYFAAAGYEPT